MPDTLAGEIPWSSTIHVVVKNDTKFEIVTVRTNQHTHTQTDAESTLTNGHGLLPHTQPGRTYYLTEVLGTAKQWVDAIEEQKKLYVAVNKK